MSDLAGTIKFMRAVIDGFTDHLEAKAASDDPATPEEMQAIWHIVATVKNHNRPPKGAGRPMRPVGLEPADRRVWIAYNANGRKWAPAIRQIYGEDISLDTQKGHRKRIKAHMDEVESFGLTLNERGRLF